jgi:CRP-like cAMP-binding protein
MTSHRPPEGSTSGPVFDRPAKPHHFTERELFKNVPPKQLEPLLVSNVSRICRLEANQKLDPTRNGTSYVYAIISGYLAIWMRSRFNPQEETFRAWRGPEQIIGEMRPLHLAETSVFKITTCEKCEFLEIRNSEFVKLAETIPEIYRNIATLLVKKMASERSRSEVMRTPGRVRRTAQTLIYLAEERCGKKQFDSGRALIIPGRIDQKEFGAYGGFSRENASRQLVDFKRKKIISYEGSKSGTEITILKADELKKLAGIQMKSARKEREKPNPK